MTASSIPFQVGISPDWVDWARDTLQTALTEVLEPLPALSHEVMPTGGETTPEILDRYDAVIAFAYRFTGQAVSRLKRLCCIARWGVGFDSVDIEACTSTDVMVALSPGAVRRPMAEGIVALMFALAKNIRPLDAQVRTGRWREKLNCQSICVRGRTLGSVGLGNIASELFSMVRGMGFGRLLSYDPYVSLE